MSSPNIRLIVLRVHKVAKYHKRIYNVCGYRFKLIIQIKK